MREVFKDVWVGDDEDFESLACSMSRQWSVVHAAKEPYHRELLGYTTKSAPKEHPYYLFARLNNVLYLNLVDAEDPKYIPDEILDEAIDFIGDRLSVGDKVFIHCNEGSSRAPAIAFLWMHENGHLPQDFREAGREFYKLYPDFRPGKGMFKAIKRRLDV